MHCVVVASCKSSVRPTRKVFRVQHIVGARFLLFPFHHLHFVVCSFVSGDLQPEIPEAGRAAPRSEARSFFWKVLKKEKRKKIEGECSKLLPSFTFVFHVFILPVFVWVFGAKNISRRITNKREIIFAFILWSDWDFHRSRQSFCVLCRCLEAEQPKCRYKAKTSQTKLFEEQKQENGNNIIDYKTTFADPLPPRKIIEPSCWNWSSKPKRQNLTSAVYATHTYLDRTKTEIVS